MVYSGIVGLEKSITSNAVLGQKVREYLLKYEEEHKIAELAFDDAIARIGTHRGLSKAIDTVLSQTKHDSPDVEFVDHEIRYAASALTRFWINRAQYAAEHVVTRKVKLDEVLKPVVGCVALERSIRRMNGVGINSLCANISLSPEDMNPILGEEHASIKAMLRNGTYMISDALSLSLDRDDIYLLEIEK